VKVVAVVLDNGDPDLEQCLNSLANQTVETDIIVVAGPKTDWGIAREYGEVHGPIRGFLNARLFGLNKAVKRGADVILSCDSDTIYHYEYAESAAECLNASLVVRAGTIIPKKDTALGRIEVAIFYKLLRMPYDHILAFRPEAVRALEKTAEFRYHREDVFTYLLLRAFPYTLCDNMIAYVDVPTFHFERLLRGDFGTVVDAVGSILS